MPSIADSQIDPNFSIGDRYRREAKNGFSDHAFTTEHVLTVQWVGNVVVEGTCSCDGLYHSEDKRYISALWEKVASDLNSELKWRLPENWNDPRY